jgi:hypothetical protein
MLLDSRGTLVNDGTRRVEQTFFFLHISPFGVANVLGQFLCPDI